MTDLRLEHDLLGERTVPAGSYYGIQTLRAVENFSITGIPISHYPRLIHSLAYIKKAAALVNQELGYERSTEIALLAMSSGRPVYEIVLEKGYLSQEQLDEVLSPENMTRPRYLG